MLYEYIQKWDSSLELAEKPSFNDLWILKNKSVRRVSDFPDYWTDDSCFTVLCGIPYSTHLYSTLYMICIGLMMAVLQPKHVALM